MDYNIIHYFVFDPINNENDKLLLENLVQYEETFNKIIQEDIGINGKLYCISDMKLNTTNIQNTK